MLIISLSQTPTVITEELQGMADGPNLWSKPMGAVTSALPHIGIGPTVVKILYQNNKTQEHTEFEQLKYMI